MYYIILYHIMYKQSARVYYLYIVNYVQFAVSQRVCILLEVINKPVHCILHIKQHKSLQTLILNSITNYLFSCFLRVLSTSFTTSCQYALIYCTVSSVLNACRLRRYLLLTAQLPSRHVFNSRRTYCRCPARVVVREFLN